MQLEPAAPYVVGVIVLNHEIPEGYILPFTELEEYLRRISHGPHQWRATLLPEPVINRQGERYRYIAVGYSNPDSGITPNFICYLFPMVNNGLIVGLPGNALVCLHPSAAIPLREAVYFEDGDLKGDILEDWGLFFHPLEELLESQGTAASSL